MAEAIYQLTSRRLLESLIALASDKETDGRVRTVVHEAIYTIQGKYLTPRLGQAGFLTGQLLWLIQQYERNPQQPSVANTALTAPDGAPIEPGYDWLDCEKE